MFRNYKVIIKGGGDLASAVAYKLYRAGFPVIITELEKPKMVRRTVCFGNCVYEDQWTVEGVTAVLVHDVDEIDNILKERKIPVLIDHSCKVKESVHPFVLIDGILAKKNSGTKVTDAPIVIGLGPGFTAGKDVDMVIETNRGHDLGRMLYKGSAEKNTGIPGSIKGYTTERVLRASCRGVVKNKREIGDIVKKGDIICYVGEKEIKANIDGILRGLIHDGIIVKENEKIGDIDPRGERDHCYSISDKGRNIAGGVLEGILVMIQSKEKIVDSVK